MAEITNPYVNPYLPSFAANRPRVDNPTPPPAPISIGGTVYKQIQPVSGYEGADAYVQTLAAGSSDICTESDPNIPRAYMVAKDSNGQPFVQAFRLIPEERPKPITMDDLNAKMSELLERMNRLEADKERGYNSDGKSGNGYAPKSPKQPNDARIPAGGRNAQGSAKPAGSPSATGYEQS